MNEVNSGAVSRSRSLPCRSIECHMQDSIVMLFTKMVMYIRRCRSVELDTPYIYLYNILGNLVRYPVCRSIIFSLFPKTKMVLGIAGHSEHH